MGTGRNENQMSKEEGEAKRARMRALADKYEAEGLEEMAEIMHRQVIAHARAEASSDVP